MKNGFHYSRRAANLPDSKFNHREEAGYILLTYSCLVSVALILFAAGYLNFQAYQVQQIEREICSIKAFYIAQAGIHMIVREVVKNPQSVLLDGSFDEGEYKGILLENPSRVRVTGTCATKDKYNSIVVKRTLEATLGAGEKSLFEGAVYTHTKPYFEKGAGTIDGKSCYAIQSWGEIRPDLLISWGISFKGDVVTWTKRDDYITISSSLKKKELIYQNINKNSNGNFGEHKKTGREETITLKGGGGKYRYNVDSAGAVWEAEIYVTGACELSQGTYYLTKIDISKGATLTGSGPVEILCVGGVNLATSAQVKGYKDQSKNFSLQGSSIPTINIAEDCRLIGTILAPQSNFIFRGGTYITGAILVGRFNKNLYPTGKKGWLIEFDEALLSPQGQGSPLTHWQELKDQNQ